MIGNRVAKQKSKKERTHGRHSSTDRFSAGQEQAECGKAASRQGKCIRIGGKARLFRQSACEQGFRPRSPRHGGLRRPLRSTRLGMEHREAILRKKGRLNAKSRVLVRLSAREDFHSSGTRLRAQPKPFLRRSSRGLHFAPQSCMALPPPAFPRTFLLLPCLFHDLYRFFLVHLVYVCGRRTYLASNASSSVPSSSFSIRSGASRKRLVKR